MIETPSATAGASISGLAAAPGGKLLAALAGGHSPGFFGIARFNAGGQLDTAFGEGGVGTIPRISHPGNRSLETAFTTVRVLDDGSILVGGYLRGRLTVVRLTPTGKLDPRFGDSGRASVPLPRYSFCCQGRALLAVQSGERT